MKRQHNIKIAACLILIASFVFLVTMYKKVSADPNTNTSPSTANNFTEEWAATEMTGGSNHYLKSPRYFGYTGAVFPYSGNTYNNNNMVNRAFGVAFERIQETADYYDNTRKPVQVWFLSGALTDYIQGNRNSITIGEVTDKDFDLHIPNIVWNAGVNIANTDARLQSTAALQDEPNSNLPSMFSEVTKWHVTGHTH